MHVGVNGWVFDSLCPPSVYMGLTRLGPRGVARGPPSACTFQGLFEPLRQGRLGMINGSGEWHAPQLSFRPPASSPAVLPPDTAGSVTTLFSRPHTQHASSVSLTRLTRSAAPRPPSPPQPSVKSVSVEAKLSCFGRGHLFLLSCRHNHLGVFFILLCYFYQENKGNNCFERCWNQFNYSDSQSYSRPFPLFCTVSHYKQKL